MTTIKQVTNNWGMYLFYLTSKLRIEVLANSFDTLSDRIPKITFSKKAAELICWLKLVTHTVFWWGVYINRKTWQSQRLLLRNLSSWTCKLVKINLVLSYTVDNWERCSHFGVAYCCLYHHLGINLQFCLLWSVT